MKTIYLDEKFQLPSDFKKGIVASVGFFDGVHKGHRSLINQLKDLAQTSGLSSAVITFPVHPRKILQSDYQPELLNSFEEKIFQLSTTGVDYCLVMNFTRELSELTAREFIQSKLKDQLNTNKLIVGYDHKFGKGRAGEFSDYQTYGKECDMEVIQAEELQEDGLHISSTTIRHLLLEGRPEKAAQVLSYNYNLEGKVVHGNQMGRELGFPTANLDLPEKGKIIPKSGIYATWVHIGDKSYLGMTYIGNRPTIFSQGEERIEVHILDFSEDLYDQCIRLEFIAYLRDDIQFDSKEGLINQLIADEEETRKTLNIHTHE